MIATTSHGIDALSRQHNIGMALLEAGRHEEAGLAFERVVDADPDAIDSWSALGTCMAALDQPDAALACQKQVLRIRRVMSTGSASAHSEQEFRALAASVLQLPQLPDGQSLAVKVGTLDECETGGRLWSSAVALCEWQLRCSGDVQECTVLEVCALRLIRTPPAPLSAA